MSCKGCVSRGLLGCMSVQSPGDILVLGQLGVKGC